MKLTRRSGLLGIVLVLIAVVMVAGAWGLTIDAPADVVDLSESTAPFAEHFDAAAGNYRLVLLLSPA